MFGKQGYMQVLGRYVREKVVHNVLLDDSVEQMLSNETKLPVNGGQGSLDESPGAVVEVRDLGMVVMQVGNGN